MQGIVFRPGDARFEGRSVDEAMAAALGDPDCVMVNRNAGSGTRILDRQAARRRAGPPGYGVQTKSHNAVAAAVPQGRADWGVAIDTVARQYGLGFIPLQEEHYDFIVPKAARPPGRAGVSRAAHRCTVREQLTQLGFAVSGEYRLPWITRRFRAAN